MTYLILFFSFLLIYYIFFLIEIHQGLNKVAEKSDLGDNNEFISVIIPFRNESKNILQSLNSLSNQSLLKERFEVIYIDDNSDDGSFEILAKSRQNQKILFYLNPLLILKNEDIKKKHLNMQLKKRMVK